MITINKECRDDLHGAESGGSVCCDKRETSLCAMLHARAQKKDLKKTVVRYLAVGSTALALLLAGPKKKAYLGCGIWRCCIL